MALDRQKVERSYYRRLARLPKEFSYQDLVKSTNDFSKKLGEGGSGSVFEGFLEDGTAVAVKKVERSEYGKIFFEAEVSTIASVQHINLVHLHGFCKHEIETGGDSYIVYDLLPNGSLDTWIFPKKGRPSDQFLSWKLRYQVAIEVAKALVYLHDYCRPPIFHFDVKPANILLDENFHAVLADFGLSVMINKAANLTHSEMIRGTRGYMAPEMIKNKQVSSKSDMYSFGKVLLDLFFGQVYVCLDMSGKDIYSENGNSDLEENTFRAFMREKLEKKEIVLLVDKRLGRVNEAEANTLIDVALSCVEEDPRRRPRNMGKVLQILEQSQQNEDPLGDGNMLIVIFHGALLDASDITQHHEKICAELSVGGEIRRTSYVSNLTNPKWEGEITFLLASSSNIHTLYVRLLNIHHELLTNAEISLLDLIEENKIKKRYDFQGDHLEGQISIELQLRKTPRTTDDLRQSVNMLEALTDTSAGGSLLEKEHDESRVVIDEFSRETHFEKALSSSYGPASEKMISDNGRGSNRGDLSELLLTDEVIVSDGCTSGETSLVQRSSSCGPILRDRTHSCEGLISTAEVKPKVFGVLVVAVHGARNVKRVRQPNTYAHILFGKEERYTKLVIDEEYPKWDEVFTFLMHEATVDVSNVTISLYSRTKKHYYYIGWVDPLIEEVIRKKHINKWHKLSSFRHVAPEVHLELQFLTLEEGLLLGETTSDMSLYPPAGSFLPDDEKDGQGTLLIIVHGAEGLGNKESAKYVECVLEYDGKRKYTKPEYSMSTLGKRNWVWEEEFKYVLDEAPLDHTLYTIIETGCGNKRPNIYISLTDIVAKKHVDKWYRPNIFCDCCKEAKIHIEMKWMPDEPT